MLILQSPRQPDADAGELSAELLLRMLLVVDAVEVAPEVGSQFALACCHGFALLEAIEMRRWATDVVRDPNFLGGRLRTVRGWRKL